MKRPRATVLVVLWLSAVGGQELFAQEPPGKDVLDRISRQGRLLAEYDQAAWHAGDAFRASKPDLTLMTHYIGQKLPNGAWRVVFGRRSPEDDAFLVAYEAIQSTSPRTFVVTRRSPVDRDTDYFLRASRALDTASATLSSLQRPYNAAIVPGPEGAWWVYTYPAVTNPKAWPLGGDTRYTITADGRAIAETRRLHNAILEPKIDSKATMSVHIHVLACMPEDTDVFVVLSRRPSVPEMIVCDPFAFVVFADGRVEFVMHSKALGIPPQ